MHWRTELSADETFHSRQLDKDKEDLVREKKLVRPRFSLIWSVSDGSGCILSRRQCRHFIWWLVEFARPTRARRPSSADQSRHWWRFSQSSSRTTQQLRWRWYRWKSNESSKTLLLNYVNQNASSLGQPTGAHTLFPTQFPHRFILIWYPCFQK
jgi:hypothetical protein